MSKINLNSRGRAYKCLECNHVGERRRVISHFYKDHVRLDESPFYCSLCLFRTTEEEALRKHVREDVYPLHNQRLNSLKQKGVSIDETRILMKSMNPRYLVEGQDYQRLSQEASDGEWQRRRKPVATLTRPSETENILDTLLDYNPDERFTPLPAALPPLVLPPAATRMFTGTQATSLFSPYQPAEVRQNQQALYVPTPVSSLAPVLTTASSLQGIAVYQASSQMPLFSSVPVTLTASTHQATPPYQVSTPYVPHSSSSSVPLANVTAPMVIPSEMPAQSTITTVSDVLRTPTTLPSQVASPLFSPAVPVDFTTSLFTAPTMPSSCTLVETKSIGVMTDEMSQCNDVRRSTDSSTLRTSTHEHDRDSGVAKAILEMSRNLVIALEKTTFQIEMTRNTLSAFLRRLDDRDRDNHSADYRSRQLFKRRSSSPPSTSEPEKKKKKSVSSSIVVPPKRH